MTDEDLPLTAATLRPRCTHHGVEACPACSTNPGSCGDPDAAQAGCGYYAATGMHWDTCPNRIDEPLGDCLESVLRRTSQKQGRIEGMTGHGGPLRREDERSLWLNYAFVGKLVRDPVGVLAAARERLQHLRGIHEHGRRSHPYLDRWEAAIDEGPHAVLALLTARNDESQALRSASPFSGLGLLSGEERMQILAAFCTWWDSQQ